MMSLFTVRCRVPKGSSRGAMTATVCGRLPESLTRRCRGRIRLVVHDHSTERIGSDTDKAAFISGKPSAVSGPGQEPVAIHGNEVDLRQHGTIPKNDGEPLCVLATWRAGGRQAPDKSGSVRFEKTKPSSRVQINSGLSC